MKKLSDIEQQPKPQGEIILYQPDETISLEVRVMDGTVWLSQQQMAELFVKDRTVIGRHIRNIYREKELDQSITCAKFAHTTRHGAVEELVQTRNVVSYNVDVVISVGHRVKSQRGLQLKQWLDQYLLDAKNEFGVLQIAESVGNSGEIVLYQPDDTTRLEVRMDRETVWLTQAQIIELFQSSKANISEHIKNIYEQGELLYEATVRNFRTVQQEGDRMVERLLTYYNLDTIISVGFRVNAKRGIKFRQWANGIIKSYMLNGYAVNQQLLSLERRFDAKLDTQHDQIKQIESTLADHQEKIDFFVRTSIPPVEGVFYDGQILDAYIKMNETSATDLLSRIR